MKHPPTWLEECEERLPYGMMIRDYHALVFNRHHRVLLTIANNGMVLPGHSGDLPTAWRYKFHFYRQRLSAVQVRELQKILEAFKRGDPDLQFDICDAGKGLIKRRKGA